MRIVADRNIPYIRGVLEPFAEVVYLGGSAISARDVADADALLVRTRTRCDAALLAGSRVKFIGTATIGSDHIDMEWCAANGITVATAAGCNAGGVLQWVSAVLARLAKEHGWRPASMTIGVVGVGNTGSLVARYARDWGFRVLCSDPPREKAEGLGRSEGFVPFEELAAGSDIVTFHTPLTFYGDHPTAGLGGKEFFDRLRRGATVINCSRGGVVDEAELADAIGSGRCTGCVDTWMHEPGIDRKLLSAATVATPHIAGYSAQGKANASAMVIAALARHFSLPVSGWYPAEVKPVERKSISWEEMTASIGSYCDPAAETTGLKAHPDSFEACRESYNYRQEYF